MHDIKLGVCPYACQSVKVCEGWATSFLDPGSILSHRCTHVKQGLIRWGGSYPPNIKANGVTKPGPTQAQTWAMSD